MPNATAPAEYAILASSKSGKKLYIRSGSVVNEYTGVTSWAGAAANTICSSVIPGWIAPGAGYNAADSTSGPWRAWAGGN
ncbi:hypothetical protein D3C86_1906910 [compost metagenome]